MTKLVGVQLYTLRQELAEDFAATIRKVAEIGYPVLEGYAGMPLSHHEVAQLIQDHDVKMPSCHLPLPFDDNERTVFDAIEAYNLEYVVVPSQPRQDFGSLDGVKRVCERLNRANEIIRRQGLTFGYHNHEFEFQEVNGHPAYEIMLEELDSSIILELDTYWAQVAGHNPAKLVERLGNRAPVLHLKDGPAKIEDRDAPQTALGEGAVDVEAVVAAGGDNTQLLIVELDFCATDMLTAVEQSYQYIKERGLDSGNN